MTQEELIKAIRTLERIQELATELAGFESIEQMGPKTIQLLGRTILQNVDRIGSILDANISRS